MARDPDSLTIKKWATSGDVRTPEDRGLTRSVGWPADFSQVGGRRPTREVFNRLFRELTAMAVELNTHGSLLEWSDRLNYVHPAAVVGSDLQPYLSKMASGPNQEGAIDPTGPQGSTRWRPLAEPAPDASTSVKGLVELATDAEAKAGTDTERAITAAGLAARTPNAATDKRGLVELATDAEAKAGTDAQRAVTPKGLAQALSTSVPVGTIFAYGANSTPNNGWLLCDGSAVSRNTYAALFAAIGTTWGAGNNSTTFRLPDLRRRVLMGSGGTKVRAPNNTVGSVGGSESATAPLPAHTHTVSSHTHSMASHTHGYTDRHNEYDLIDEGNDGDLWEGSASNHRWDIEETEITDNRTTGSGGGGSTGSGGGGGTGSTGSGGGHNNMQPSAVVMYIIKT